MKAGVPPRSTPQAGDLVGDTAEPRSIAAPGAGQDLPATVSVARDAPATLAPHVAALPNAKGEDGLTVGERRFVEEFLVDLNATYAAERAGYGKGKRKSAKEIGCQLRKRPHVAEAIGQALTERTGVTRAYVVDQLVRIATSSIDDFLTWTETGDVRVKPASEIDPAKFAAVVDVWRKSDNSVQVKLYDKLQALDQLAKLLGVAPKEAAPTIATQVNITLPEDVSRVIYGGKADAA